MNIVSSPTTESHQAVPGNSGQPAVSRLTSLLLPSISDVLFIVLMVLLFMVGTDWSTLLADGDTGWHIRTGEYILSTHTVPARDLFSFVDPGTRWFAWEWLADLLFGALHQAAGLKGVVLFSGAIICLSMLILFRYMIWRGASLHIAVILTILAANTLRFHFLARPHIFTTLLFVIALWMLDRDWSRPSPAIWALVPLTILWTNLHGGFLILLIAIGFFGISALLHRETWRFKRYAVLGLACLAATLVNPYGWQLHSHIWEYLRSDWLAKYIDEFQSPLFQSDSNLRFEILLLLGLGFSLEMLRRRRYHEVLLILFWAHCAMTSGRHITMYALVAIPPIADQLTLLWDQWTKDSPRRSITRALRDVMDDMAPAVRRTSLWVPAVLVLMAVGAFGIKWPVDFSPKRFPVDLMARNAALLNGPGHEDVRILHPDSWGGYFNYKFYPHRHTFVDGRSDYFGITILNEYRSIYAGTEKWPLLDARYHWQYALIPPDWPLALVLKRSPDWILRDQDKLALLFERR